ncbi:hypothetical protein [Vreelandella olivaria]|uniref:hypothetical protein n=1 Tax=Vreelandella olivaria TaxID=390919 RepID=UPI00201E82CA|nr:hypothetical protein [Halomonas olivaria]
MKRADSRLEALERRVAETENKTVVAQISAIMDELSAKAAGDDSPRPSESLIDVLEGGSNA